MLRQGPIQYMTRNQAQIFCVIKCIETSQVTLATHLGRPFINLPRPPEFMFSTVLDCHQSLSEFSFYFSSTWLRGHRLGCIALFKVTKIPILPSDIERL